MPESMDERFRLVGESKVLSGPQTRLDVNLGYRVLGGSSSCNGTLCVRGVRADFDNWGLEGWSGNEVFNYMRKVFSC